MNDIDMVASCLMKISMLRDQLVAIGENTKTEELVPIALNGFSSSWEQLVRSVCAREKSPPKNTRLQTLSAKVEEIQNLVLIGKMRGGDKK
jgi:hypothetical protein